MNFSERAKNAVKSYFTRNWRRQDLMNSGEIPLNAYLSLTIVYGTLVCAMLTATIGFFKCMVWGARGVPTVFGAVACSLYVHFTPPWLETRRLLFMMCAAYHFGVSFCLFTSLKASEQICVLGVLLTSTIIIGCFFALAFLTRQRREIYLIWPFLSCGGVLGHFIAYAIGFYEGISFYLTLMVCTVTILPAYLVVYSQEILYDARFGYIDGVDRTFTFFFHLPAVVVHATRLYLGAEIEQHRQN